MTGPSSAPRGERPGTPGTGWEQQLVRGLEVVVPEDDGNPFAWTEPAEGEYRPNRATRRAAKHRGGTRAPKPATKPSSKNPDSETSPS
jgi:hypothetical protein